MNRRKSPRQKELELRWVKTLNQNAPGTENSILNLWKNNQVPITELISEIYMLVKVIVADIEKGMMKAILKHRSNKLTLASLKTVRYWLMSIWTVCIHKNRKSRSHK